MLHCYAWCKKGWSKRRFWLKNPQFVLSWRIKALEENIHWSLPDIVKNIIYIQLRLQQKAFHKTKAKFLKLHHKYNYDFQVFALNGRRLVSYKKIKKTYTFQKLNLLLHPNIRHHWLEVDWSCDPVHHIRWRVNALLQWAFCDTLLNGYIWKTTLCKWKTISPYLRVFFPHWVFVQF